MDNFDLEKELVEFIKCRYEKGEEICIVTFTFLFNNYYNTHYNLESLLEDKLNFKFIIKSGKSYPFYFINHLE